MRYERRALTREQVCKRAGTILANLDTKRAPQDGAAFLSSWGHMWDLMEEARRAGFIWTAVNTDWSYADAGEDSSGVKRRRLISGEFGIPVPLPNDVQLATDLPEFLNWACVTRPRNE